MPVLWRNGLRYLARRPWATLLMILGVALGVGVVVAIDIANTGARRAFDLSTQALAGRATHQIVGGPEGVDETLYTRLRVEAGLHNLAPVVTGYLSSPQLGDRPLQLLGLDPFADSPFRDLFAASRLDPTALTTFLTQPGALLISADLAAGFGIAPGAALSIDSNGEKRTGFVAGLLAPRDGYSRRALSGVVIADISTAQEISGRLGHLDRIDVILANSSPNQIARIDALLPVGVRLLPAEARNGSVVEMTRAFQVNLTAMSLLALVVGMFLIYNTITFSVVQRRELFGTLRCLGVTDREIFGLVLAEAGAVGLIGALLGLGLGVILGRGAMALVSQTIDDLYFVSTVNSFAVPVLSLGKGLALGLLATLASAFPPAREAARVEPRHALRRSAIEDSLLRAAPWLALAGVGLILSGGFLLSFSRGGLTLAFAGITGIVIGLAMQTPLITHLAMRLAPWLLQPLLGPLGRMAPRAVSHSLSRTSIAIAALMVAVSVTIGVTLMIDSFRGTVETWLAQSLQGDIYISVPGVTAADASGTLDPAVVAMAERWPQVREVRRLRRAVVDSPLGPVRVAAVDKLTYGPELFAEATGAPTEMWAQVAAGAVLVSEPFANRFALPRRGAQVTLFTPQGERTFPVVGIYYDYASSAGTVMMALPIYRSLWNDADLTALALDVQAGGDPDSVASALSGRVASLQKALVQPNRILRAEALVVFDRTFAITAALRLLATLVAFVGVLSALLALQLERSREWGVLRALGLTVRQLGQLVLLETGLMGLVAGVLAWPTGLILSLILVYVINLRAFGWTLQMRLAVGPFAAALGIALSAALLAGIYPALRVGRMAVAAALRGE